MAATVEATQVQPQPQSAATLRTIVELVRRIMHADVTSIVSFSLREKTVTWEAAAGFRAHQVDSDHPLVRPLTNRIATRALSAEDVVILKDLERTTELRPEHFPVHVAEGVCDAAVASLRIRGEILGALVAGYRTAHDFSDDEKQLLQGLADLAAIALDNAHLLESVGEAEKIWKQTFDALDEGVLVYDRHGFITHCNISAAETIHLATDEMIGLPFAEAFAKLFGKRAADYYLADNHGASTVIEVQTEYGRRYLFSMFPIHKTQGAIGTVATWKDVTRLSEIQDQLGRSQRLASVGQLAAGVAHEVNNPLAAITTCAEAILRDMRRSNVSHQAPSAPQWNYYLEEIVRQALRCKEITRGLLDLTRQRRAKLVQCDVNLIAKECAKVAVQTADKDVEFEVALDENVPQIATDADMMRQVIDNLLKNAIDALGDRKGKVTVSTHRDADRAVIEVADTGSGIAPELLSQIFDPFFSTKGPGKGYGLGLAISSTLAESLGGGINVDSKQGEGSRFRLWIPCRPPE